MEDLAALARWIWTYRVGLTPLFVATLLGSGGVTLRFALDSTPMWARGGIILLAAVPPLIYASRIAKWWLRWWDALLTVAAALWLAWFALYDTDQYAMAALGLGALIITMWISMGLDADLRSRVRVEGRFRNWPEAAKRIGFPEARWTNHKEIPGQGWTARLEWVAGAYDRDDVIRHVAKFEGARGLPVGALRLMHHGRSRNSVDALCVLDDPNTKAIEWPGPVAAEQSITDPVPLGPHADQSLATIVRYHKDQGARRVLIGGSTNSGKSGIINQLVGEDSCRTDVVQLGMDLKGGLELGPWEKVLLWMVSDIGGCIEMLAALEAAAVYRQDFMRTLGVRVWPVSPSLPAITLTVDEIRRLAASTAGRSHREQTVLLDRLIDVATQGRAVGIGLAAAGQHLTLQAMGSSQFSTQFDIRIGLRMNKADSTVYVFPDDPGIRLHEISADLPGTGFVKDGEILDRLPFRGYFWSDELVAHVAEMRAGAGPELDEGTAMAMAAASPRFARVWAALGHDIPIVDGDTRGDTRGDTGGDTRTTTAGTGGDTRRDTRGDTGGDAGGDGPGDGDGDIWEPPDPDVSWGAVAKAHARRTGITPPTTLRTPEPRKLSQAEAVAAVRRMLAEAGPEGVAPRDLYTAATRSSSWLHPLINQWCDEGTAMRTSKGRYADPRSVYARVAR